MKIAFYNTRPYDRIWFDSVAKEEGFEVLYFEEGMDCDSLSYAFGCDVICINEPYGIDDRIIDEIKKKGIKAVLVRNDAEDEGDYVTHIMKGIPFINIPQSSPKSLLKSKWVSYLP